MNRAASFLLFAAPLALSILAARAVETVRVETKNGAPRIVVDGKPVRARMFFGNPGSAPITVGPAGNVVSFDFVAQQTSAGHGTMHFRFGDKPGEVDLNNIVVTDLDTKQRVIPDTTFVRNDSRGGRVSEAVVHAVPDKDWTFWPQGRTNTVATVSIGSGTEGTSTWRSDELHITLKAPPDGKWPGFHVFHAVNLTLEKGHHYHVAFSARATPERDLTIAFYNVENGKYLYAGGPDVFGSQIKLAAAEGVNFVSYSIGMPWPDPGTSTDWTDVDAACQRVLDANPNALLIPRIDILPSDNWFAAHPDALMKWNTPPERTAPDFDVASPDFRRDAAQHLREFVTHLERKFGPHMAGYHVTGQNTDEWFYEATWEHPLNGYSEATQTQWRAWLTTRYATDVALQAAWHDPAATLAGATVPSPDARYASPGGSFRDAAKEQAVIDFTDFQQQMMADCVCALTHAVREASGGKKLVLVFYGYNFEFSSVANGPGTSGHYALREILNSPDIDVVCSPISYFDRGLGEGAPSMTPSESIALAGKMYLREDDTRTYLALPSQHEPGFDAAVDTEQATAAELERNVAQESLRNFATWWMDLPATGWFNDPRLWSLMADLKPLDQYMLDHPQAYAPETAAVIDAASMQLVTPAGHNMSGQTVGVARRALGRFGAPYGQYLQDDVEAGKVHAKLYVFLSPWKMSADQRHALLSATQGATRIWCYAPGYLEGDHTSLEAMGELTGFKMKPETGIKAWASPTDLGRKLGLTKSFGGEVTLDPLFSAADAHPDEVLATYSNGDAAVAMRQTDQGLSVFVGTPGLTAELLRVVAAKAGVHLYADNNCNVWANGPFLVLHASKDGVVHVDTGSGPRLIKDFLAKKTLGAGPTMTLMLHKGENAVLKIAP